MDIPHSHHPDALLATLSDSEHFQLVANVFKQLGDPTRVRLFWLLVMTRTASSICLP